MNHHLIRATAVSALTFALSGCVVPPGPYYQQSVPPAAYAAPQVEYGSDQYIYSDGVPYAVVDGAQVAVVFDPGLGWGYYDGYRRWHGAPPRWREDFDRHYPGGRGFAPGGPRGESGRPGGPPPGRPAEFRDRPQEFRGRPAEMQGRPGGPPPVARVNEQRPPPPAAREQRPPAPRPGPGPSRECGPPGQPRC